MRITFPYICPFSRDQAASEQIWGSPVCGRLPSSVAERILIGRRSQGFFRSDFTVFPGPIFARLPDMAVSSCLSCADEISSLMVFHVGMWDLYTLIFQHPWSLAVLASCGTPMFLANHASHCVGREQFSIKDFLFINSFWPLR